MDEEKWKLLTEDSGISVFEATSGSSAILTKLRGEVPGVNPETICNLYFSGSVEEKQKYHPEICEQKVIRDVDEDFKIVKTVFSQSGSIF